MKKNINDFITEYESWAGQEKYKDFKFISKSLTPTWKRRLLENKKFNIWGLLFGPIYLMSLGAAFSGLFILLLEIFAGCLIQAFSNDLSLVILSVFVFNALFTRNTNKVYIKQKQEFKKKMQDFDPDAPIEYFNISSLRLIALTILTGGFYLSYWFYRQSKAIKVSQKDNSISPLADALFFVFTADRIFKRMHRSFGEPKNFNPKISALGILGLPILIGIFSYILGINMAFAQTPEEIEEVMNMLYSTRTFMTIQILCSWFIYIILALIIRKWQYGIQEYCKKNQQEKTKVCGWEVFWIIIGVLLSYEIFISTYICILAWQNIYNLIPVLAAVAS